MRPHLVLRSAPIRTHRSGFTLLELLVALAVFSILAVMAYSGLAQIVRSRESVESAIDSQIATRRWMSQLEADFEQVVAAPVRGPYGEIEPAVRGSNSEVWLSVQQWQSPGGALRRQLTRIGISRAGLELRRSQRLQLDPGPLNEVGTRVLADDVSGFELRYLDRRLEPQNQWPPLGSNRVDELPRAIEVRIETRSMGALRRVFELPESSDAPG